MLVFTRGLCRGWILDNWLQFQKSVMESKMSTNGGTKKAHLKVQPENTINVLCRNITFGLLFVGTMVFFLFQSWQEQTTSKSYIYSFFSTHSCFLRSFARVSIDLALQCTFSQYFWCWKKYLRYLNTKSLKLWSLKEIEEKGKNTIPHKTVFVIIIIIWFVLIRYSC